MRMIAAGLLALVLPLLAGAKTADPRKVPSRSGRGFADRTARASAWPQGIPSKWTEADYNWDAELPGEGHASPVVWGNKVFITSASTETAERIVLCLDTQTGKPVWERRVSFARPSEAQVQ